MKKRCQIAFILSLIVFTSVSGGPTGCAVHYFDSKNGTEHLWGFGHLKMKATVAHEGVKSVVRGSEVLGLSAGWLDHRPSVIAGWNRQEQLEIVNPDTMIRLEWPDSSFFNIRIGTNFPSEFLSSNTDHTTKPTPEVHP